MAQIEVKFDHNLDLSSIVIPLNTPSADEIGGKDPMTGNLYEAKQTAVYGIRVPLVKIGDIVVDAASVMLFQLDTKTPIPSLELIIFDGLGLIRSLQNPGTDNEVRIQIIPKFENAYKKIDMKFYISSYDADGKMLHFKCIYKVPELYNSRVECFGELTTYEVFEQIAKNCRLGFASNVSGSGSDQRYIYCANESYLELMRKAISTSGDSGNDIQSRVMYDYWIDLWNNINIVDVYERFNNVDSDKEIMIYIDANKGEAAPSGKDTDMFIRTPAILSNAPSNIETELYIDHYNTFNQSVQATRGTNRVVSSYHMGDSESLQYKLIDDDQKKDIFTKYEYIGECYQDFDYLLASRCRSMMEDKMKQETIEVTVDSPLISRPKGSKINIYWFDLDNTVHQKKSALNIKEKDIITNIPVPEAPGLEKSEQNVYHINKYISGQYYILSSSILYTGGHWKTTLRLTRPRSSKNQYIDMSDITKTIK